MMKAITSWFIWLFTNPLFLLLFVPVLVAFMAVMMKSAARPGKTWPPAIQDCLIGFDLGVMAIVTMLAVAAKAAKDLQALQSKVSIMTGGMNQTSLSVITTGIQIAATYVVSAFILAFLFSIGLFAMCKLVAKKGWKDKPIELKIRWVFIVDLIGLVFLGCTLMMTGEAK